MKSKNLDHCIPERGRGGGGGGREYEILSTFGCELSGSEWKSRDFTEKNDQNLVNKLEPCSKANQNHCYSLYPNSGQYGLNIAPF